MCGLIQRLPDQREEALKKAIVEENERIDIENEKSFTEREQKRGNNPNPILRFDSIRLHSQSAEYLIRVLASSRHHRSYQ